jgi:hypothetical protein
MNMKIEINEFQTIVAISKELDRLGYKLDLRYKNPRVVITWGQSKTYDYQCALDVAMFNHKRYTTLDQLKKMER